MKKVRYALVGFGGIAENRLAKEGFARDTARFQPLASAELVGATDVNAAREAAATALGVKWYPSTRAVFDDADIDAVVIATNNLTHAPLGMEALNAGKHILVEKPMATTAADADKLLALGKKLGKAVAVDHMMIYNAWNKKAKELVAGNALGAVNDMTLHMEFAYGYDPAEAATWRCNNIAEMGGPIGDVASHCFYMAEFLFDKRITGLAAVYWPKLMDIKAEDGAYIKFELEGGLRGTVRASFNEPRGGLGGTLSNLGFELYGDKAALRSYGTLFQLSGHPGEPVPQRLVLDDFVEAKNVLPDTVGNIYQGIIERHARSILDNKPWMDDTASHNLRLCEAAHASAQQGGRWVAVA